MQKINAQKAFPLAECPARGRADGYAPGCILNQLALADQRNVGQPLVFGGTNKMRLIKQGFLSLQIPH
jgi:hypothetical protein